MANSQLASLRGEPLLSHYPPHTSTLDRILPLPNISAPQNSLQAQVVPLSQHYFKFFKNSLLSEDSPPRPRAAVALWRWLGHGDILHYNHQVVPLTTAHRSSQGSIDDHLSFEPTLPLGDWKVCRTSNTMIVSKDGQKGRRDEDDQFSAFELERDLFDNYEDK